MLSKSKVLSRIEFCFELLKGAALSGLLILILLGLTRGLAFFLYGRSADIPMTEILHALWMGFRFDLSATCYILILPLLFAGPLSLLLGSQALRLVSQSLRIYFLAIWLILIFLSFIDLVYYSYFQDHLNIMIFGFFEDDTAALVRTLWKNYPVIWIFLGWGLAALLFWRALMRLFPLHHISQADRSWKLAPLVLTLLLILSLGARGSFALFPLGVADATISNHPFVNYLAFSGIHSLHRAIKLRNREQGVWDLNARNFGYSSAQAAAQDYLGKELPPSDDPLLWFEKKLPQNSWAEKTKPHVLVLVMESFGSTWLRDQSNQFNVLGDLQKHFQQDLLFQNFLPSMMATIGSLSSLMINTAHRPLGGFLTETQSLGVSFRTAPALFYKKAGYQTRFIYGGAIGWRDIDKFARKQGFDSIEGDSEISKKLNRPFERHDWGLYDEDVWDYLEQTLNESTAPQLVMVMTTTNHPPYQVPSTYRAKTLEIPEHIRKNLNVELDLAQKRFVAFQYSNQKLSEFLDRIKASSLGEKTLVAATGDHSFLITNYSSQQLLAKWQVPFYLYLPAPLRSQIHLNPKAFGSHADLFPTLYPLSLSNQTVYSMGRNLLDPKEIHEAYHFSNLAMSSKGAVIAENAKKTRYFQWQEGQVELSTADSSSDLDAMAKRYRALMSYLDFYYEFERKNSRPR